MLGYTHEQLVGRALWEIGVFKDLTASREAFAELQRTGYIRYENLPLETSDGKHIAVEFVSNVYRVNHTRVAQCNIRDITERRRSDTALQESEQKFRSLFNVLPIGVSILDQQRKLVDVNPALETILDMPRAELLAGGTVGRQYLRADGTPMPPDELPSVRAYHEQRTIPGTEIGIVKEDGEVHWVSVGAVPFPLPGLGVAVTTVDVTERRRVQKALQESEERFRLAFENASTGMCLVGLDASYLRVNSAMCAMLGYTREELEGKHIADISHPDDQDTSPAFVHQVLTDGGGCANYEKRYLHKQGYIVWAHVSLSLVRDDQGSPLYFVSQIRDITARKEAERALQEREEALRRYAEEQAALYAIASAISAVGDPEELLATVLEVVLPVVGAVAGGAMLPGLTIRDAPRVAAWKNMDGASGAVIEAALEAARWPFSPPLREGEPLTGSAPEMALAKLYTASLPVADLGSHLVIPFCAEENDVLGHLILVWNAPHVLREAEQQLLDAVSRQVGLALHNMQLHQQSEQLAVIHERQRLARELHDSVTQSLYSLTLLTEAGRRMAAAGNVERAVPYLDRLGQIALQSLKEMRLLIYELRPLELQREQLVPILKHRLEAVEERAGVQTSLETEGPIALPPRVEEGLYRIAIEALNNTLKHAGATAVAVRIRMQKARVVLEVMDDGRGFDPRRAADVGGMGLLNMQERVEEMGGILTVESSPNGGTTVRAQIPLDESEVER
jgi:PAS domain S-box-containing protein